MTTDEQRATRFKAIKERLAEGGDEFLKYAPQDMAWLVMELTGAANSLANAQDNVQALRKEVGRHVRERQQWQRWHNQELGKMSAKIGQARAETAVAREKLRAVIKKLHEERRDFTDRHVNPSLFGELADVKPVDVQVPNEGHPFFRRVPRAFKYPVC